jgi:hypothetical protein
VGRNQTQTTKDTIDRTLSDTTAAKSTVNQSPAERDMLIFDEWHGGAGNPETGFGGSWELKDLTPTPTLPTA